MFAFLGQFVARRWPWVIAAWLVLVALVRFVAPAWDDVTKDGDLAFLPASMPSVQGQRLAAEAFAATRAKSELVIIAARQDRKLSPADLKIADQITARFHNRLGISEFLRGQRSLRDANAAEQAPAAFELALQEFDEAIELDEQFAEAWHNRAIVCQQINKPAEATEARATAWQLAPDLKHRPDQLLPQLTSDLPLVEIWNRHHEIFRSKLRSVDRQALMTVLKISNEFMATDNIRVLGLVEDELLQLQRQFVGPEAAGLQFGISGSAAVGGDMLRAAVESIRNTEWLTLVLVVAILLLVYRAPLLVVVPIVTIGVSLSIATGLLALLTQLHLIPGFTWWDFKIFKTTKIFIVVILYGCGTDFCLFLLARLREELASETRVSTAVGLALARVGDALAASALTTILGLSMMFFADFGKFRNSGPAIGLCLFVTLAACLTLAPALVCALGRTVFWPFSVQVLESRDGNKDGVVPGWLERIWEWTANGLVRYPVRILVPCVLLVAPLAIAGFFTADRVTFDFLSELPPSRTTIRGNELLRRHFPVGEGSPVVILARRTGAGFDSSDKQAAAQAMAAIFDLTNKLSQVPGVESVRSLAAPRGDPPKPISFSPTGVKDLIRREHRVAESLFLSQIPPYQGETTRFEAVLQDNPFSIAALDTLARIDAALTEATGRPDSFWQGAKFVYTGTTAGIRDLRTVTRSDYWRIQVLVTAAVWGVLLFIFRRPWISAYLVASVLFSYFVTIGATELFFSWLYGDTFQGLDWKVPIFLFVILVAVGEDYNIYLVTRVFEEQSRLGPFRGLREGILRTGGIITSCGVIMAGSFVSMVTGSLRGISELGFALTLGILLDTFIVRTILVSAFLSLVARWDARQVSREVPVPEDSVSARI